MAKLLFIYFTREGQTARIARTLADTLAEGHQCELLDGSQSLPDLLPVADHYIIGASIHYGHFPKRMYQLIEANLTLLAQHPSAFFGINLTARKADKNTPETSPYMRRFAQKSRWQPALQGVFAGALYYPRYNFFDRNMIRLIMKMTGGCTDTSKEIEYTDWEAVARFAERVELLTQRAQ